MTGPSDTADAAGEGDAAADAAADPTADGEPDGAADATGADPDSAPDDSAELDVSPGGLRVVTLNLRCLIDDWALRLPIITAALAELDPDLMGFQEACAEAGADNLAELLAALALETGRTYTVERTVTHIAWQRYSEGIAVVSALPVLASDVQSLPGGVFTRKVVMVRVQTELGDVVFATTHLDHQSATARTGQIEAALEDLDAFAAAGEVRVLTGDLNEGPEAGDVADTLTEAGWVDTWASLAPVGEAGLTYPASAPTARIDYIWLDAGDAPVAAVEAAPFLDAAVEGVYGSDHYGVTARLGPP